MTGCYTCGGGMGKHDPVAHDQYSDEAIGGLGSGPRYPVPEDDFEPVEDSLSGWWYMRPGESMDEHAARLKADPRWQQ